MNLKTRCPHCTEFFEVSTGQVGEVVNCPHCFGRVKIAAPAGNRKKNYGERYTFECPSCESPLEATSAMVGNSGKCPSCGTELVIPAKGKQATLKAAPVAAIADDSQQAMPITEKSEQPDQVTSLREIHAFAAAGLSAPKIVKLQNGNKAIACPKCFHNNSADSFFCRNCAMPFSIENRADAQNSSGATARSSLIFAMLSLPLFVVGIFQIIALVLAIKALTASKPSEKRRSYPAIIAIVLSVATLLAAIIQWAS